MSSLARTPILSLATTGYLLHVLTWRGHGKIRARVDQYLARFGFSHEQLVRLLKVLVALNIVRFANGFLTDWARNNWLFKRQQWKWDEEIAVVTGGSNGIGSFIVRGLAAKGVKVVVVDIQPLPEELEKLSNVSYFECDITSPDRVHETAFNITSSIGSPSILVNNAGIAQAHTILATKPDYLRKLFDVNLFSHFYTVQAFLPAMISKKKGHIVTIASAASYLSAVGLVDYSASKAAVLAFHEGLVQELKHRYGCPEIKLSSVHPTFVNTSLCDSYMKSVRLEKALVLEPQDVAEAVVKQILSGRSGQLFLPNFPIAIASGVRAWPIWLQEMFRDSMRNTIDERSV